ncbi:MAG TPA: hypothetical protein VFW21_09865, partial [Mycobacterium sp.]|nr:hypothetical protein [Mycobacterium sp.]
RALGRERPTREAHGWRARRGDAPIPCRGSSSCKDRGGHTAGGGDALRQLGAMDAPDTWKVAGLRPAPRPYSEIIGGERGGFLGRVWGRGLSSVGQDEPCQTAAG